LRLLAVSASFVAGVAASFTWHVPIASVILFLAGLVPLLVLFKLRSWGLLLPIALLFMLLGVLRVDMAAPPPAGFQPWIGVKGIKLQGVVMEDPEPQGSVVRFRFRAERVNPGNGWQDASGDVLVMAKPSLPLAQEREAPFIRYGDSLELAGSLDMAPAYADFDYGDYLARQGILAIMSLPNVALISEGHGSEALALVYRWRGSLSSSLERSVPEPQAALAQTLLLGIRGGLPTDVKDAFRDTSTTHLLAISGMNVGVVLALVLPVSVFLLGRKRHLYLLLPLALLWLYGALSAFSPSVERAVIMATLYLAALALGRQRSAISALGFAAALMVALEPGVLYDISFQLSFAAMAGIVLLWPPLEDAANAALERILAQESWQQTTARWLVGGLAVSLAAVLASLPLLAFNFHRVALLSIPATLLALLALPMALVASLAAAIGGLIAPFLGQALGWLAWLPLSYLLGVVELLARIPGTVIAVGHTSAAMVCGYYVALALLMSLVWLAKHREAGWLPWRKKAPQIRDSKEQAWPAPATYAALSVAVIAGLLWTADLSLPDGKLHVTFLDVGQGDAAFIQTPEGQQVVVDGGPDPRQLLQALGKQMPFWDRTLDVVVLSHAHSDHLTGLVEVLERYRVAVIVDNPYPYDSPIHVQWRSLTEVEGVRVLEAEEGQAIKLGGRVTLEVLNPPSPLIGGTSSDIDNNSTVLRIRYGDVSILFTGDLQREGEMSLVARDAAMESAVLKVAHHGSVTSSSMEFLNVVQPRIAVVSVGANNSFGHPSPEVMGRLVNVLRTDKSGDISLVSDGHSIQIHKQR